MKKIILYLFLIFIINITKSFAQKADSIHFKNNTVYLEGLGNIGGKYSLNYERKILKDNNGFFTARIGFIFPVEQFYGINYATTILINHVFGIYKNHLEIGIGGRFVATRYKDIYGKLTSYTELDKGECI